MLTSNSGHPAFFFFAISTEVQRLGKSLCYTWISEKSLEAAQNFRNFIVVFRQQEDRSWRTKFSSLPSTMNQNYDNLSNDEQDDLKSATLLEVTA